MALPGRNDVCPCGSGKKYKKCHLEVDEARSRTLARPMTTTEWLDVNVSQLIDTLRRPAERAPGLLTRATDFFGRDVTFESAMTDRLFRDAVLFDGPNDGTHLLETVSDEGPAELADARENIRSELLKSHLSILEVKEVKRGEGLGLQDLLTGTEVYIHDPELAASLEPMEYLLGRVLRFPDRPLLLASFEKLRFHGRKAATAAVQAHVVREGLELDETCAEWLSKNALVVTRLARAAAAPA